MSSALLLFSLRSPVTTSTNSVVAMSFWEVDLEVLLWISLGEPPLDWVCFGDSFPCWGPQHVWFTQLPVFLGQSRTQSLALSFSPLTLYCKIQEKKTRKEINSRNYVIVSRLTSFSFSKSTNSGWMVVEWIPSLWKNSLTFSAICM